MADVTTCRYADLAHGSAQRPWNSRLIEAGAPGTSLQVSLDAGERIEATFVAALIGVEQERLRHGGNLRVVAGDEEQRTLLRLAGCERLLVTAPGTTHLDLSVLLQCRADGTAGILVHGPALQNARLSLPGAYAWMRRLAADLLIIDLAELPHINSVLVAWILQIGQAGKPAPLQLHNVNRQVSIQLSQLRLHHLLDVKTSES